MSTIWGSGDFDILGATLIRPPPLYRTFLPLEPGLSVLYGRNGAGKSRILEGLEAAVTGIKGRAWAWLHIRLRTDVEVGEEDLSGHLIEMLRKHQTEIERLTSMASGGLNTLQRLLAVALLEEWREYEPDDEDAPRLAQELVTAGVLSLIPVGVLGTHQWRVFVSGLPSDDTPLLSRRATRYREGWNAALRVADDDERFVALSEAMDTFGLKDEWEIDENWPLPFSNPLQPELLIEVGLLTLDRPLCDVYGTPQGDLNEQTLQHLIHVDGSRRRALVPGTANLEPALVEDLSHLSSRASELYGAVLERAPRLRCLMFPVEAWLTEPALSWRADDIDGPADLPLSELSQAQRRWAEIAIAATLIEYQASGGRAVMLLDEPELALHSLAVRTMATGLGSLASTINVDIFAATHSAALLEAPDVHLLHVTRAGGGDTVIHRLYGVHEQEAERLGMTRAELLQLTRVFVIVEGAQDQFIIEETCRDDLAAARARIIPMRGGPNAASLIDAQFLLRFTDAIFLIVLDAVTPEDADEAWEAAKRDWSTTRDLKIVQKNLKTALPAGVKIEHKFLRELMLSSLAAGQQSRLRFKPLPEPDVICYLPLSAFSTRFDSWQQLLDLHQRASTTQAFKDWLVDHHKFVLDEPAIRGAARQMDELHLDLTALATAMRRAAEAPERKSS